MLIGPLEGGCRAGHVEDFFFTEPVEVKQEVLARKIIPDFAGGEGFFYHRIEMFVYIHHFFPSHSRFYIKIEHNSHIPVGIVKDAVNFEFTRIMVDGGILSSAKMDWPTEWI